MLTSAVCLGQMQITAMCIQMCLKTGGFIFSLVSVLIQCAFYAKAEDWPKNLLSDRTTNIPLFLLVWPQNRGVSLNACCLSLPLSLPFSPAPFLLLSGNFNGFLL